MRNAIFWPMLAQVALVVAVWIRLYYMRIGEMRRRHIHPQKVANTRLAAEVLQDITAADNFRNLFEVPVLFFAVCLALAVADAVTVPQLALAWAFVGLRALHSFIHTTYNKVMHRFAVYVASTLCVFAMWGAFALHLLADR